MPTDVNIPAEEDTVTDAISNLISKWTYDLYETYSGFWDGEIFLLSGDIAIVAPPNHTFDIGDELIEWIQDKDFKEDWRRKS